MSEYEGKYDRRLLARCRELEAELKRAQEIVDEQRGAVAKTDADNDELREENQRLRKLLLEAANDIEEWGAYAGDYFQEKHDLAGDVAKYRRAALEGK